MTVDMKNLSNQLRAEQKLTAQKDAEIAELKQAVAERDGYLNSLDQTAKDYGYNNIDEFLETAVALFEQHNSHAAYTDPRHPDPTVT